MGEVALRQAILHGLIAAVFIEAVLEVWDIRRASNRLAFWVLALAFPLVILPCFLLLAPWRTQDHFAAGWALLDSRRWGDVTVLGVRADYAALGLMVAAGIALCLRDLVPLLRSGKAKASPNETASTPASVSLLDQQTVRAVVSARSAALGIIAPEVVFLDDDSPVLFVRGVRRPALVASCGLFASLTEDQLEAALIHELAHIRFRDPLVGWLLMAVRLVMFWNPAVQLICRAVAQEMEHRADEAAARAGSGQALSSALAALGAPHVIGNWIASGPRALRQARNSGMIKARIFAAGVSVAAILFFVV